MHSSLANMPALSLSIGMWKQGSLSDKFTHKKCAKEIQINLNTDLDGQIMGGDL